MDVRNVLCCCTKVGKLTRYTKTVNSSSLSVTRITWKSCNFLSSRSSSASGLHQLTPITTGWRTSHFRPSTSASQFFIFANSWSFIFSGDTYKSNPASKIQKFKRYLHITVWCMYAGDLNNQRLSGATVVFCWDKNINICVKLTFWQNFIKWSYNKKTL